MESDQHPIAVHHLRRWEETSLFGLGNLSTNSFSWSKLTRRGFCYITLRDLSSLEATCSSIYNRQGALVGLFSHVTKDESLASNRTAPLAPLNQPSVPIKPVSSSMNLSLHLF